MCVDYKGLGKCVRRERKKRRWTQEKLAEQADISVSFLGHIERGSRKASVETMCKLAAVFNIPLDILIPYEKPYAIQEEPGHLVYREICDNMHKHLFAMLIEKCDEKGE